MEITAIKKYLHQNLLDVQKARAAYIIIPQVFGAYQASTRIHGVDLEPLFIHFKIDTFTQVLSERILFLPAEKIYERFLQDTTSLDTLIKEQKIFGDKIDKIGQAYLADPKKHNVGDALKALGESAFQWWQYAVIGEDKGAVIQNQIVQHFAQKFNVAADEAKDKVSILAHPDHRSIFNEERHQFLRLALHVNDDNSEFDKLIDRYLQNFFWFKSNFVKYVSLDKFKLRQDLEHEYQTRGKSAIQDELQNLADLEKRLADEKKKIISGLSLTQIELEKIYFAQRIVSWLDIRKEGMMRHFYYLTKMVEDAARELEISYDEAALHTSEELCSRLCGEKIDGTIPQARYLGTLLTYANHKQTVAFQPETDLFEAMLKEVFNAGLLLKGTVASQGNVETVEGKACVVANPDKDDFTPGLILVTSMTRIEFVPLMKKAMAIITDEGGLACHAAIVSRELGIPCIIATKRATHMLKTGQTVQMNMKNGEIKII